VPKPGEAARADRCTVREELPGAGASPLQCDEADRLVQACSADTQNGSACYARGWMLRQRQLLADQPGQAALLQNSELRAAEDAADPWVRQPPDAAAEASGVGGVADALTSRELGWSTLRDLQYLRPRGRPSAEVAANARLGEDLGSAAASTSGTHAGAQVPAGQDDRAADQPRNHNHVPASGLAGGCFRCHAQGTAISTPAYPWSYSACLPALQASVATQRCSCMSTGHV
jgi:hypothetical protein